MVQPGVSFSSIISANRFGPLQDNDEDPPEPPYSSDPSADSGSAPTPRRLSMSTLPRKPRHTKRHSTATIEQPLLTNDDEIIHSFTEAEIHHPPRQLKPPLQAEHKTRRTPTPVTPAPSRAPTPEPDLSRPSSVFTNLLSLLQNAYHLYKSGTPILDILITLWPTISTLLPSIFQ